MNEEKNNIGIDNTGVNNSLPPMGTVPLGTNMDTNNVHDKYGLPPISNFTNFNNSYETPTVDNNTSVFDLMDQFESVNNGNVSNQNSINNTPVMPQMNITNNSIVNIPLVGITNEHQGKGLSTIMLKRSMDEIINNRVMSYVTEINTTTETDNLQALRLYKNLGFLEDYSYPQAYMPMLNIK